MAHFSDPDGNAPLTLLCAVPDGTPPMIDVERVDYIRSAGDGHGGGRTTSTAELLGLERNPNSPDDDWVEYEAGNVTLAVMTPHTHDYEFAPLPATTIALRVADVAVGEGEARGRWARGRGDVGLRTLQGSRSERSRGQPHPPSPPLRAVPRRLHALMQVEHVDFVSFLTQDIPRAKHFYSDVLGLEIETQGESDMEFRAGQVTLDIFDPSSIGQTVRPEPRGYGAACPGRRRRPSRARAKRGCLRRRYVQTSVCRMAFFKDPDGNALMLHRRFDV